MPATTTNISPIPVIAIFDIGKTNKKRFLFDESYNVVEEISSKFEETTDDDGDACENLQALSQWVRSAMDELFARKDIVVKAVNVSTYGASFVHIDKNGLPVAPLYNYLKPFPKELEAEFYERYNGAVTFSMHTASPILGNLNSGLQLYWLKNRKPELYEKIRFSLHLPQYITYLFTGRTYSDITSIGCHTALWNFPQNHYHEWLYREGMIQRLAPIFPSDQAMHANWKGNPILCGVGLHDSSAALIPYLAGFKSPFLLISTGTWCISLNPFNQSKLSVEELQDDCLCYLEYRGKPIKASRLFAGYLHEQEVKKLAAFYNVPEDYYKTVAFDQDILSRLTGRSSNWVQRSEKRPVAEDFSSLNLSDFPDYETAYHRLMLSIAEAQVYATDLVLNGAPVNHIFVDGGFGKNPIYMQLMAAAYPHLDVYAASVAQATALGAALAIHRYWNSKPVPDNLINLQHFAADVRV
ncbi:MAG: FGGY-family carbohydrate kinase [Chitinophagaceae bacterium]